MKSSFLIQNGSKDLVVFFGGWGCDTNQFTHLNSERYDVLMFWDYSELPEKLELPKRYENYILISWSLGVYFANYLSQKSGLKFTKAIAINGTLDPIDNYQGIPSKIFQGTIDSMDHAGREKFYRRMCGSRDSLKKYMENSPQRSCEEQKDELIKIYDFVMNNPLEENIYSSAIRGERDFIFPSENLKRFWADDAVTIDLPHFIFFEFKYWEEIVDYAERDK